MQFDGRAERSHAFGASICDLTNGTDAYTARDHHPRLIVDPFASIAPPAAPRCP